MTDAEIPQSAGWRMKVAAFALAAAIFAVLWFLVASLGTKWGWWTWQVGLGQMTIGIGPMIAMLAVGVSVVAQLIALIKAPRFQPFIIALVATLISAMLLFRLQGFGATALSLPPIHDIQTDWSEPVRFTDAVLEAREAQGETNPILDDPVIPEEVDARWPGLGGMRVADAQEQAEQLYLDEERGFKPMDPVFFDQEPNEIAELAERLLTSRGWELITPFEGQQGRDIIQLEATVTSGWFGFKDDVAVRIKAVEGATRVDMRSTSRVGLSDIGANSKRVYAFMMEILDRGDGRVES
ncbi:MAG: DUF1499 domain-containing protein [Pseudomonadota bacterium]